MIAGGEDISEHGKIFFMLIALWQLQRVKVGIGDAEMLGLPARIWSHRYIAIGTTGEPWIDGEAEACKAALAIFTKTTGDVKGHDDPISLMKRGDARAYLLNNAHVLMPEDNTRLRRRAPFVHMEIRATDTRGGDAHNCIIGMLNLGICNLFNSNFKWSFINHSPHDWLLC